MLKKLEMTNTEFVSSSKKLLGASSEITSCDACGFEIVAVSRLAIFAVDLLLQKS